MSPTEFVKPYPVFDDVFNEPSPMNKKHFLPLASVNAVVVDDDLDTWLHFVTPIEPLLEGEFGAWSDEFHDFYNYESQIAFHVADGRYTFTGDMNFFDYESGAIFKGFPGREDEIHEDYHVLVHREMEFRPVGVSEW